MVGSTLPIMLSVNAADAYVMAQRTFCDICGKEINRWYKVTVIPEGMNPNINIAPLLKNSGSCDVCQNCFYTAISCGKEKANDLEI